MYAIPDNEFYKKRIENTLIKNSSLIEIFKLSYLKIEMKIEDETIRRKIIFRSFVSGAFCGFSFGWNFRNYGGIVKY